MKYSDLSFKVQVLKLFTISSIVPCTKKSGKTDLTMFIVLRIFYGKRKIEIECRKTLTFQLMSGI